MTWLLTLALVFPSTLAPIARAADTTPVPAAPRRAAEEAAPEAAVVRHAPTLNSGRIEGSVRQLAGEDVTLNGGAVITAALLVPGTPQVRLNGNPTFGGVVEGAGSAQPSDYRVTLNGNATLGRLITRTDPIALPTVAAPPASTGVRDVVVNNPGQSVGDFATLRDLTLNGNAGTVAVPPGTYRNFTAQGSGGFVLGIANSTQPATYNFNRLALNGQSRIEILGPVILTLASGVSLNGRVGSSSNPLWLTLNVASGGVSLNGGSSLYGLVQAPTGTITLNGNTLLQGSVVCDRLIVNGNSLLKGLSGTALETVNPTSASQGQTLEVTLRGRNTHWVQGQTRAAFGAEVAVGGAAPGEPGPVTVVDATTAIAQVQVSATAALAPRTVRVETAAAASSPAESDVLVDGFNVMASTPPGSAAIEVRTLAGDGTPGFANGPSGTARFNNPQGVAADAAGVVYVADTGNHRLRRIAADGTVSTLAGDGTPGFADGPAAQARFRDPSGVAAGPDGAIYVADTGNHRLRRIAADGTVSTLAGDGTPGLQNGTGNQARFNAPRAVALDTLGNLYVADTGNSAVRRIAPDGTVSTLAGDGSVGSSDSPGARFDGLAGIAVNGEQIYVYLADTGNHRIRRLDSAGTVMTIAGAERGFADGSAGESRFADPAGIAVDGSGHLVVTETTNSIVREVDLGQALSGGASAVSTLAGTGARGLTNGAGNQARFHTPRGVVVISGSTVVVADTGNHVVRRLLRPPTITAVTPGRAGIGALVTITGERFDERGPERNQVSFTKQGGGQTTAVVTTAARTMLTVTVPADATTGRIRLQTEGGTAFSPADFEVAAPIITDFNPKSGSAGASVTLMGASLKAETGEPTVTFAGGSGARVAAQATSSSATEVRVTVPEAAVTGTIELTNAYGRAVTGQVFTVTAAPDFSLTAAPTSVQAVQNTTATSMISLSSRQASFTALARLAAVGLPASVRATFTPPQITAGDSSTLTLDLNNSGVTPGTYSFRVTATATIEGRELVREAALSLTVLAGGQTTLSGRVLAAEDAQPIIGATVSLDGRTATTDAAGAFLLSGVAAGANRAVMVDGRTASAPGRTYPVIAEPVTILAGQPNAVPYTFFLPTIDIQYEVPVIPGQMTLVTTPRVPGLKTMIPPGANLRNRDGSPVSRVSMTPVPIDRTPAPLPANATTMMVYTNQPGGAVSDIAMPVVYPNLGGAEPGARVPLYNFNHDTVVWEIYGYGRVSADGRTIEPEMDPATGRPYGLRDFSWHFPFTAPSGNPSSPSCPASRGSSPVDFPTGIKIETATDFSFGGARGGLALTRTYSSALAVRGFFGRFGRGYKDNYDIRLTGDFQVGGSGRLVWPEEGTGRLFSYARTEGGGTLVFTSTETIVGLGDVVRRLGDGTLEYRRKTGEVMRFDVTGRLLSMADRNGNTTTLGYTGANLTRVTDPVGRSITLEYDTNGRVTQVTDPIQRIWRYAYNGGMLISVTDPLDQSTRYSYDGAGQLVEVTDKRGNRVKRIEYGTNFVTKQTFADGGFEQYSYTFAGGAITGVTITDSLGRAKIKRFNAAGHVVEEIDELGQRSVIKRDVMTNLPLETTGHCGCTEAVKEFDARGNVTTMTDELGQTMRTEYEPVFNNVTKTTDRLGRATTYTYDARGNRLSMTNALNEMTRYTYDELGQRTSMTDALNHTWRMEYDALGDVIAQIDPLGNRIAMEYDGIGRMTATVDPLGRRTIVRYDALSRIVEKTEPSGAITKFAYDPNGNQMSTTDALNRTWQMEYNQKNRLVKKTDPLNRVMRMEYNTDDELLTEISPSGRTTRYTYDARGQRMIMIDPEGGVVRYTYDKDRNLLALQDQRDNTMTFAYDPLDRVISIIDPLGRARSLTYDAEGHLIASIDRLGRSTTVAYDALHRPMTVQYADATLSYSYDAGGRRVGVNDTQSGSITWAYDEANRLLTETTPAGVVSYSHNAAGERVSMTAADRPPVTYSYDPAGRLSTISQGAETFTYSYDVLSRRTGLERPNGISTSYTYDEVNRFLRIKHQSGENPPVEDFQYGYNADDEMTSITSIFSAPLIPSADRIASPADQANRITSFGGAALTFDAEGQITSKSGASGVTAYDWDHRGRLSKVTLPDGRQVSYRYDTLGRRISQTTNGVTVQSLYDGDDTVLDTRSDGSQADYLNGPLEDEMLRQLTPATGPLYFIQDHLGTTVALTGPGGGVAERLQYEAFGEGLASSAVRHGYTGRERDEATGLIYYRARWYDPQQGRFLSEDPSGVGEGLNLYPYASNNPLRYRDPSGLSGVEYLPLTTNGYSKNKENLIKKVLGDLQESCECVYAFQKAGLDLEAVFRKGFAIGSAYLLSDRYISDAQLGLEPGIRQTTYPIVGSEGVPAFTGNNYPGGPKIVTDGRPRIFLNNAAFGSNGGECRLREVLAHELIHAAGKGPEYHWYNGFLGFTDLDYLGQDLDRIIKDCGCKK